MKAASMPTGSWFKLLAPLAAVALLAAGCGELNDNPREGVGLRVGFDGVATATRADGGDIGARLTTSPCDGCEEVKTVIAGAIVITHTDTPYTSDSVTNITDAQREALEEDAIDSANHISILQLPSAENVVEFRVPTGSSAQFQLFAIGLRNRRTVLDEIQDDDPIWYGFTSQFLTPDDLKPGDTFTIELQPACGVDNPPQNTPQCGI